MTTLVCHQIDPQANSSLLIDEWRELSEKWLPVTPSDSMWRYSRSHKPADIRQGWKLHVSATILSASQILKAVAPHLKRRDVLFKAPTSLDELQKLNAGLQYGYAQVGKFITVYPRSPREARSLIRELHELTRDLQAPNVPFDFRFRDGIVFYRYGSFESLTVEDANGRRVPALRAESGELVPDFRYAETAKPHWVPPLFPIEVLTPSQNNPLATTYRPYKSLAQRGKGGVYKAFDFASSPPRPCILKEGRYCGETSWDATDGASLVAHEEVVLRSLRRRGIPVPAVFTSFEIQRNKYLVTELVEGTTLNDLLSKRQRRLRADRVVAYALQLAALIDRIHEAGWAWRDCKPANIIVSKDGVLRPIDFEGASPINMVARRVWSTPNFTPDLFFAGSGRLSDLYAFGAVVYFMIAGQLPETPKPVLLKTLRRNTPERLSDFVDRLLNPGSILTARQAWQELQLCG
jgi:Protein kinase domain